MSQRDYAWLWLGASKTVVGGGAGATAGGGNILLKTPAHKLDGPEHTTPDDTITLDSTTTEHGLLPKLSGDATDALLGDGTWGSPTAPFGIEEDGSVIVASATVINARHGLDVTDLTGGVAALDVDESELAIGTLIKTLTNKSGASVAVGDVVVVSAANADAFTTTTTAQFTHPIGVAQETIANNASGNVAIAGYVSTVNTNGSTFSLRTYLETNGSAKQATANTTRRQGSFGVVLSTSANPAALLFGTTEQGGSSPTFGTPALTFDTTNAAGSTDEVIRRDSQIAVFDGTAPVTQAFGDAAATGSAAKAARRDHKHAMPNAAVTTSGLTQATARLLGRTTASTGAIEEITVGSGLTFSGGSLSASGGGGGSASGCQACRTTTLSVTSDPQTIAINGTDIFDPDGYHDPASNNTRLTVPTGKGSRLFMAAARVESDQATTGRIQIKKNGSTTIASSFTAVGFAISITISVYLVDADYIEYVILGLNGHNLITTDFPMEFTLAPIG